jgi:hypothetical protein
MSDSSRLTVEVFGKVNCRPHCRVILTSMHDDAVVWSAGGAMQHLLKWHYLAGRLNGLTELIRMRDDQHAREALRVDGE